MAVDFIVLKDVFGQRLSLWRAEKHSHDARLRLEAEAALEFTASDVNAFDVGPSCTCRIQNLVHSVVQLQSTRSYGSDCRSEAGMSLPQ